MIIMNPGAGHVPDAHEKNAIANMSQLALDAELREYKRKPTDDDEGRFAFDVIDKHGVARTVDMPGLPLERVRYVDKATQNIWDFPRLYVDGSSWVWMFAVRQLVAAPERDE
jgi:hypothetical protein